MSRPVYREEASLVMALRKSTIHLENGDEIGLNLQQRVIARAIDTMCTKGQRAVLYFYYGRGMSMVEISEMLGINVSTVSRTIKKGLSHVKQALKLVEGET